MRLHCVCPAIKYNETLHKGDNGTNTQAHTQIDDVVLFIYTP